MLLRHAPAMSFKLTVDMSPFETAPVHCPPGVYIIYLNCECECDFYSHGKRRESRIHVNVIFIALRQTPYLQERSVTAP